MSPQLAAGIARFVLPALAGAVLAGLSVYTTTDDIEGAIIAAVVTLLTPLAGGAAWGAYDGARAKRGDVHVADVGAGLAGAPPGTLRPPVVAVGATTSPGER